MKKLILLSLIFLPFYIHAQNIKAGFILGFNATQIDCDTYAGFHKAGLNVGAVSTIPFSDKISLSFEILYTQKGSAELRNRKITSQTGLPLIKYKLKLDYVEVPILVHYNDKQITFGAGIGIGRLVRFKEWNEGQENLYPTNPYQSMDYNIIGEGSYMINDHLAFNLRIAYSLMGIRPFQCSPGRFGGQKNKLISIRMMYIF